MPWVSTLIQTHPLSPTKGKPHQADPQAGLGLDIGIKLNVVCTRSVCIGTAFIQHSSLWLKTPHAVEKTMEKEESSRRA